MTDTIFDMEYVHVDNLAADQLMVDDLIEINDEVVQILELSSIKNGFVISYENEYGEKDTIEIDDYSIFKLFVMR